jgi:FAD:protein FMN transferase
LSPKANHPNNPMPIATDLPVNDCHHHTFRAMGCQMAVWVQSDHPAIAQEACAEVEQLFAQYEAQLSRFLPSSELSRVNQQAGAWVAVSPLFGQLVDTAVQAAASTDGLFDPTVQTALVNAGYGADWATTTPIRPQTSTREQAQLGWEQIELAQDKAAVRLPAGMGLDFGGIAKGYTAVVASQLLSQVGPNLVNAGGDLVAGAAPAGQPGWPVAIADPFRRGHNVATLWLQEACLATSGQDYRRWAGGHHLIDPRTGQPAVSEVWTASVWHPSAVVAETWATAVLVAGKEAGLTMLAHMGIAGLLVDHDGHLTLSWAMEPRIYLT